MRHKTNGSGTREIAAERASRSTTSDRLDPRGRRRTEAVRANRCGTSKPLRTQRSKHHARSARPTWAQEERKRSARAARNARSKHHEQSARPTWVQENGSGTLRTAADPPRNEPTAKRRRWDGGSNRVGCGSMARVERLARHRFRHAAAVALESRLSNDEVAGSATQRSTATRGATRRSCE